MISKETFCKLLHLGVFNVVFHCYHVQYKHFIPDRKLHNRNSAQKKYCQMTRGWKQFQNITRINHISSSEAGTDTISHLSTNHIQLCTKTKVCALTETTWDETDLLGVRQYEVSLNWGETTWHETDLRGKMTWGDFDPEPEAKLALGWGGDDLGRIWPEVILHLGSIGLQSHFKVTSGLHHINWPVTKQSKVKAM